jgi:hypothetical protein
MKVIVDTSIWSLTLRRNSPPDEISRGKGLRDLITKGRVVLLGAIPQEVLVGIRHPEQWIHSIEKLSSGFSRLGNNNSISLNIV